MDNTCTYITNGLSTDSLVATLNLKLHNTGYDYAWHWMTITKYYRDSAEIVGVLYHSGDKYTL